MYFQNFPKMLYSFDLSGTSPVAVTNIFTRFSINSSVVDNAYAFYKYSLVDGDTPEIIADKQYGDPLLHWVICLTNNLSDPLFELPLSVNALEKKIIHQYGYPSIANAYSEIHHYILETKKVLSEVDGLKIETSSNSTITLDQYNYSSNSLVQKPLNTPVVETIQFRANNSNPNSAITSTLTITSTYRPVYVYGHEESLNESKRAIKILRPEYVSSLSLEMERVLNG